MPFPDGSSGERLAVDVPAMSDVKYENGPSRVVYLIDNAVVTSPNPPAFATDELAAARRPRVAAQRPNRIADTFERWR